ncbi:MAG: hypothetical protein HQL26_07415 [Candidatus Omnitrophica bacterium]|nr:hypothetical protein [Candidatus Omnitrophota bacterium]
MKCKLYKIFIFTIFCASSSPLWAQSVPDGSILRAITVLKEKSSAALTANHKLQAEYDQVMQQKAALEQQISDVKKNSQTSAETSEVIRAMQAQETEKIAEYRKQVATVENDVMVHQAKNLALKKQMLDLEEETRVLKLKFADLQYEKRKLELDIKINELGLQNKKHERTAEVNDLRAKLDDYKDKEKKVLLEINDWESKRGDALGAAEKMAGDIGDLEKEYADLIDQKQQVSRQDKVSFKDERLVEIDRQRMEKEKQKKDLQLEVQGLERDYSDLDGAVRNTIEQQKSHQALVEQIIALDKENQLLREEIIQRKKR